MPIYKKVNQDFFKKWNAEMAYVVGFFMADGNMVLTKRSTHFISFYSVDRDLLVEMQNVMGSSHKLSKRNNDNSFRFQIGNKEMFNDLRLLGITPNKSKRMGIPKMPNKFMEDFVRGYFDGDGNIWSGYVNKGRVKSTPVLQAAFTSGCEDFLNNLLDILKERGIQGGSLFKVKNKECYRLLFSTLDALKLYEIMYNVPSKLVLKRKKLVFDKFIKMRV